MLTKFSSNCVTFHSNCRLFLCSGKLDLEMTSFIRASDIAVKQGPAADSISVKTRILGLLYSVCELDAHSVSGNDHTMSFFAIGYMN